MKTIKQDTSAIEMLKSCFSYGYGYHNRYTEDIIRKYGENAVKTEWEKLEANYDIEYNVHEDREGVTYNSLIPKAQPLEA